VKCFSRQWQESEVPARWKWRYVSHCNITAKTSLSLLGPGRSGLSGSAETPVEAIPWAQKREALATTAHQRYQGSFRPSLGSLMSTNHHTFEASGRGKEMVTLINCLVVAYSFERLFFRQESLVLFRFLRHCFESAIAF
jgi:hypothetical protein